MKTYISDEENAKKGSYLPIVLSPNNEMRLFSKYVGYDSLLPYVYRAGAVMPKNALMSLISPNGIKSCNIESYSENYRYRGDIHSYFNYIIINGFKERILQDMKKNPTQEHTETLSILKNVVESLKKNIMKGFNEDNKIYTSWSPEG